jgi:hypothetical protein
MPEFIDELVGVDIQMHPDGTVTPLGFTWHTRHFKIESWGRRRTDTRDGRRRQVYLVQTLDGDTWELGRDAETAQWHLMRHWAVRHKMV